jgi:hypothetical protein
MLTIFTLAVAIILGAIISLATNSWWFLLIALAVHAIGTVLVMTFIGKRLQQQDKPDPVTEAHEEAGDRHRGSAAHGAF